MLEISEKEILRGLRQDNPWWESAGVPVASEFSKKRAYFERFKDVALNWEVRRSIILMGPRRVGKTVMLKQLIRQMIEEGFPRKSLLFVSMDTPLYSGMSPERILELFEKHANLASSERRVVILDEIQYLKNWEVHLKVLTDRYPTTRFIASGSAAAALRLKSLESGAGRFTDFFLPPLTFAEYLKFSDLESELIAPGEGMKLLCRAKDIDRLNAAFIDYLNVGGYPEAVMNPSVRANPEQFLGRDIIDKVLLRDLPSLYGIQDTQELNRLFMTIAYHSGQEINLDNLAKSSGVAKNTISRYLEYLEAAFLIVRVRRVDDNGRTFQRERHFKAYLTNPSMRAALFTPLRDGDEALGNMAETAVFSQYFHTNQMKNIFYARWKSGRQDREVDMVLIDPATRRPLWAYEIKWSDRFADHPEELKGLIEFAKKNEPLHIPPEASTKTRTEETTVDGVVIRHVPCALHCYQIGRYVAR